MNHTHDVKGNDETTSLFFFHKIALSLSLLTAILLTIESTLSLYGVSLCKTSACDIVANFLNIKEDLLIAGGAAFFWCLSALFHFSYRNKKSYFYASTILVMIAVAFDGSLIGYQFFTINEFCLLCHLVALSLILIGCTWVIAERHFLLLFCILAAWTGGFFSQSIMSMPVPSASPHNMVIYDTTRPSPATDPNYPSITLFFSMNCPHCMEIVEFLESQELNKANWKFASVDLDTQSLEKLVLFTERASTHQNVFSTLYDIKKMKTSSLTNSDSISSIKERNTQSLRFLTTLGINSIPVILVEETSSKTIILRGKEQSLGYIQQLLKEH